jgi:very-short-patch-repair endonuclease
VSRFAHAAARSAALQAFGFDVLRFTNDDVYGNLEGVLETVPMRLAELRPRIDETAT